MKLASKKNYRLVISSKQEQVQTPKLNGEYFSLQSFL